MMSKKRGLNRIAEPLAKNIKMEIKTKTPTASSSIVLSSECTFSDLEDDCFERIFEWLPLNELFSLSRTCHRLHRLVGKYFQEKYPDARMKIVSFKSNGQLSIELEPHNIEIRYFKRFIKNIKIMPDSDVYTVEPMDLFAYLKLNCCQNLTKLIMSQIDYFQSAELYADSVREQLKYLKYIEFDRCFIEDIHCAFLRHCQQLESLTLKITKNFHSNALFNYGITWTYQRYTALKKFRFFFNGDTYFVELDSFFSQNSQIDSVTCANPFVVKSVLKNALKLRQLTLYNVDAIFLANVHQILHKHCEQIQVLNICCVQNPMKLSSEQIESIGSLKAFQGFQFWENHQHRNALSMATALKHINHLKMLSVELYTVKLSMEMLMNIIECCPNLERLHLDAMIGSESFGNLRFKDIILPLIQNLSKLYEITIHCPYFDLTFCTQTDLIELNAARSNLNNACALTIYADLELIQKFIILSNSLITVKPISMIDECLCLSHPVLYW